MSVTVTNNQYGVLTLWGPLNLHKELFNFSLALEGRGHVRAVGPFSRRALGLMAIGSH